MEKDRFFQMRVDDAFLKELDNWRRLQPDLPARAGAVRRLIEIGLSHDPAPEGSPREKDEQAEIDRRGGAGFIFFEGVEAGRSGDPVSIPYATSLAKEVWLKGYIDGMKKQIAAQSAPDDTEP